MELEVAVEPAAALAGGNGEEMLPCEALQQRAHAVEELHRILAHLEVTAIARHELGVALRRQSRHGDAHGVLQPEADDVARALGVGHLEAELAARVLNAGGDRRRRVDDRAVPVEDQQAEFHGRACSTNALTSAGNGDSSVMGAPVTGCRNESRAAWSRSRCFKRRFSAKAPYFSSPTIGYPACARCTRIWCVRPVSSSTSRKLNSALAFSFFTLVTAAMPSSRTLTRRSPAAVTYL